MVKLFKGNNKNCETNDTCKENLLNPLLIEMFMDGIRKPHPQLAHE